MNVKFTNPGFEYSIDSILLFQTEEATPYWSDALLYFYPQLKKEELQKRTLDGKKEYLLETLSEVYGDIKEELEEKVIQYNDHFSKYKGQIEDALSEAFEIDTRSICNDLTANITMNPVCPRFLKEHYFDVFYKNSERGAIGVSIHEIIHYIWFYVWNKNFNDSYDEYDTPSLKWILSEMVVESIMRDERLSSINPYFPRENGGCIYPYFQDMIVDNTLILDTIEQMYRNNSMVDFMKKAYQYCLRYETTIRSHIEEAEKEF